MQQERLYRRLRHKAREFVSISREALDLTQKPVFTCNVCGHRIRHPLDSPRHVSPLFERETVIGAGFRPKEKCPICSANDRLRFVADALARETDLYTKPCSVLEIAPIQGFARLLKRRNPKSTYLSGDLAPGRAMRVLDVTHLDLPDGQFDYVVCCHVMEHIPAEQTALSELTRVLKPGGTLLLSMPICVTRAHTEEDPSVTSEADRLAVFGQPDHVRLYALDTAERLRSFGLEVREIIADASWADDIRRYGLIPGDRCYLCRRKR